MSRPVPQPISALLDAAHNIPSALLNPSAYEITDDVEHLRVLLDKMDDLSFIDS